MFNLNIHEYTFPVVKTLVEDNKLKQKLKIMEIAICNTVQSNFNIDVNDLMKFYNNKINQLHAQIDTTLKQLRIDKKKSYNPFKFGGQKNNSSKKNLPKPTSFYGLYCRVA